MSDPVSSGASSHLQSQLASGSSGGGESGGTSPFFFIMTFGNIGGVNILAAGKHFANALGLAGIFTNTANSMGLKSIMGGDKLSKSPMGKPLSKKATPLKPPNLGVAGGSPTIGSPKGI